MQQVLDFSAWFKPKAALEVALRLGANGEVEAPALGLESVDPRGHQCRFRVPAAIASGGVHAALLINPWQTFEPSMADGLRQLVARFQLGDSVTEGGSAAVLGSPLQSLASLREVLRAQGDPGLQAGDVITTGALAPSVLLSAGVAIQGSVTGLGLAPVNLRT
jgi:2-keto-4-pentenoate hydratase